MVACIIPDLFEPKMEWESPPLTQRAIWMELRSSTYPPPINPILRSSLGKKGKTGNPNPLSCCWIDSRPQWNWLKDGLGFETFCWDCAVPPLVEIPSGDKIPFAGILADFARKNQSYLGRIWIWIILVNLWLFFQFLIEF